MCLLLLIETWRIIETTFYISMYKMYYKVFCDIITTEILWSAFKCPESKLVGPSG